MTGVCIAILRLSPQNRVLMAFRQARCFSECPVSQTLHKQGGAESLRQGSEAALLVQEGWRAPASRVVITSLILLLPPRRLSLCFALSGSRFAADHAQFRQRTLCAKPSSKAAGSRPFTSTPETPDAVHSGGVRRNIEEVVFWIEKNDSIPFLNGRHSFSQNSWKVLRLQQAHDSSEFAAIVQCHEPGALDHRHSVKKTYFETRRSQCKGRPWVLDGEANLHEAARLRLLETQLSDASRFLIRLKTSLI